MANLPETNQWPAGIYQIETQDPVMGGPPDLGQAKGIANVAAQQLADRTVYLKEEIDDIRNHVTDDGQIGSGGAYIKDGEIVWENGVNRITKYDGGGNVQLRFGHKYDGGQVFTHNGTAFYIGGSHGAANGAMFLMVASNGGAGIGQPVTWGKQLQLKHDDILYDNVSLLLPIGAEITFTGDTPPPGYLEEDRSTLSRAAYPALWAHAQASGMLDATGADTGMFGPGDGSTTFQLPDMRGEIIRGWDHGRGVDTGRALGSAQGDAIRNITGFVGKTTGSSAQDSLFALDNPPVTGAFYGEVHQSMQVTGAGNLDQRVVGMGLDASRVVPTADENRMRNAARMICIRAY